MHLCLGDSKETQNHIYTARNKTRITNTNNTCEKVRNTAFGLKCTDVMHTIGSNVLNIPITASEIFTSKWS